MKYDVFISYNSTDKSAADAVCHYLEERKLCCFIAPRDITPPDWAGSITRAIEHSKAFVIVVSEHAIEFNEVAKEITLATRVSSYIFPFRVDGSRLDGRMIYHLSAFHWSDAVDPPRGSRSRAFCRESGRYCTIIMGPYTAAREHIRESTVFFTAADIGERRPQSPVRRER